MKTNLTGYLWSKYECFLISGCQDIDLKTIMQCDRKENVDDWVYKIALHTLCSRANDDTVQISG